MRIPDTSSCIMELILSSWAWSLEKSGLAFPRQKAITPTIKGKTHSIIRPNSRLSMNIKVMLPKVRNEQRIMPRTNWETKFCTWVISLVTRVTKVPAPNLSIWEKEKAMLCRNASLRISLPMFWPDRWTNTLFMEPQNPPNSTSPIICRPRMKMSFRSPTPPVSRPSTPSSTMRLMIPGCTRSISTSPTINSPAMTARGR